MRRNHPLLTFALAACILLGLSIWRAETAVPMPTSSHECAERVIHAMFNCPDKDLYTYIMLSASNNQGIGQATVGQQNYETQERNNWENAVGNCFTEQEFKRFLDSGLNTMYHSYAYTFGCEIAVEEIEIGELENDWQEYIVHLRLTTEHKADRLCQVTCRMVFEEGTGVIQDINMDAMELLDVIRAYGNGGETQVVCIMYEESTFAEVLSDSEYIFKATCTGNAVEGHNLVDSFSVEEVIKGGIEETFIETRYIEYENYEIGRTYVLFADKVEKNDSTDYYLPSWDVCLDEEENIISYSEYITDFPEDVMNYGELAEYINTEQQLPKK